MEFHPVGFASNGGDTMQIDAFSTTITPAIT
jgi:hypothetical protein